jgi:ATP-dependent DNA ligase
MNDSSCWHYDPVIPVRWRFQFCIQSPMAFPLQPPILPMLAKRVDAIPAHGPASEPIWSFEPKWDGFRALIFRDHDQLYIQSRDAKPLDRYFPELRAPILAQLPTQCVLDGEIIIVSPSGPGGSLALDFDALQLRIHPAASRIKLLSEQTPASIVFFDLLAEGELDLTAEPFAHRRARLAAILENAQPPLHLTPTTLDRSTAQDWFSRFEGAGLDGVIAKPLAGPYTPDKRTMLKIKHERDCDCVVAGFRWHKDGPGTAIGSLLLGLYDASGTLQNVGTCSSFTASKRLELATFLEPFRVTSPQDREAHPWSRWAADTTGSRMPGAKSRWTGSKDLSWEALRPELVVEVAYEHMQGNRFRHLAHFRRWRTDKPPATCTYAQLEVVPPQELAAIFLAQR